MTYPYRPNRPYLVIRAGIPVWTASASGSPSAREIRDAERRFAECPGCPHYSAEPGRPLPVTEYSPGRYRNRFRLAYPAPGYNGQDPINPGDPRLGDPYRFRRHA